MFQVDHIECYVTMIHSETQCVVVFHDGEYILDRNTVYLKNGEKNDRTYYDIAGGTDLVFK